MFLNSSDRGMKAARSSRASHSTAVLIEIIMDLVQELMEGSGDRASTADALESIPQLDPVLANRSQATPPSASVHPVPSSPCYPLNLSALCMHEFIRTNGSEESEGGIIVPVSVRFPCDFIYVLDESCSDECLNLMMEALHHQIEKFTDENRVCLAPLDRKQSIDFDSFITCSREGKTRLHERISALKCCPLTQWANVFEGIDAFFSHQAQSNRLIQVLILSNRIVSCRIPHPLLHCVTIAGIWPNCDEENIKRFASTLSAKYVEVRKREDIDAIFQYNLVLTFSAREPGYECTNVNPPQDFSHSAQLRISPGQRYYLNFRLKIRPDPPAQASDCPNPFVVDIACNCSNFTVRCSLELVFRPSNWPEPAKNREALQWYCNAVADSAILEAENQGDLKEALKALKRAMEHITREGEVAGIQFSEARRKLEESMADFLRRLA